MYNLSYSNKNEPDISEVFHFTDSFFEEQAEVVYANEDNEADEL